MALRSLLLALLVAQARPTAFGETEGHNVRVEPQKLRVKKKHRHHKGVGCEPLSPPKIDGKFSHIDVKPFRDPTGVFVLAAHVATRHQGNLLMLSFFGIWKYHPESRIVVVDNASPVPLTKLIPQKLQQSHKHELVILREEISGYEFGAYSRGLKYLAAGKGKWKLKEFDHVYFMQGQIYLNEPIPQKLPGKCEMVPLMHGPGLPPKNSAGYKVIAGHLQSKGLLEGHDLSPLGVHGNGDSGSAHVSFVATLAGAELLAKTGALDAHFTKKQTAIWCEPLLGIMINRLMRRYVGKAGAGGCASAELPWKKGWGRWTKLHGSGQGGFAHSDTMALADFVRFGDANMDGKLTKDELAAQITSRPKQSEESFYTMCTMLPYVDLGWARQFMLRPWAPEPHADKLAQAALAAAETNAATGAAEGECDARSAAFWAHEASNILAFPLINDQFKLEHEFMPYSNIMFHKLKAGESIWGPEQPLPPFGGRPANPDPAHAAERGAFARAFVSALWSAAGNADGGSLADATGGLDFGALMHMVSKTENEATDAFMSMMLPFCASASNWIASSVRDYLSADVVLAWGTKPALSLPQAFTPNITKFNQDVISWDWRWKDLITGKNAPGQDHPRAEPPVAWVTARSSGMYFLQWALRCMRCEH